MENENIGKNKESVGKSKRDKNWRKRYDYKNNDNWKIYYKKEVIRKMFDKEWFNEKIEMYLEFGNEEEEVKFECVNIDLW